MAAGSDSAADGSNSSLDRWTGWFANLQDEQRVERLDRCRELEKVLRECEAAAAPPPPPPRRGWFRSGTPDAATTTKSDAGEAYSTTAIEGFPMGLRMTKYFGWRGVLAEVEQESASESDAAAVTKGIVKSCAREKHAVWACRGVAVGCGKDLAALKSCFEQEGAPLVLTHPGTAYEPSSSTSGSGRPIPCREQQERLGSCVAVGAAELLERRRKQQEGTTN